MGLKGPFWVPRRPIGRRALLFWPKNIPILGLKKTFEKRRGITLIFWSGRRQILDRFFNFVPKSPKLVIFGIFGELYGGDPYFRAKIYDFCQAPELSSFFRKNRKNSIFQKRALSSRIGDFSSKNRGKIFLRKFLGFLAENRQKWRFSASLGDPQGRRGSSLRLKMGPLGAHFGRPCRAARAQVWAQNWALRTQF